MDQDDGRILGGFALQAGDQQSCRAHIRSLEVTAMHLMSRDNGGCDRRPASLRSSACASSRRLSPSSVPFIAGHPPQTSA